MAVCDRRDRAVGHSGPLSITATEVCQAGRWAEACTALRSCETGAGGVQLSPQHGLSRVLWVSVLPRPTRSASTCRKWGCPTWESLSTSSVTVPWSCRTLARRPLRHKDQFSLAQSTA